MSKLNQDQELMDSILAKEWHTLYAEEIILVMNYAKDQQAIIDEHTEVIKLQDTDLRKYEKQIESLKAQLAVYKEDMAKDAEKIAELTNKIGKPCRWCGFENKRGAND